MLLSEMLKEAGVKIKRQNTEDFSPIERRKKKRTRHTWWKKDTAKATDSEK